MPRNSAGNYSLASASFIPKTSIVNTPVNSDFNDIALALTQTVASTGVTPVTAPILGADGGVIKPSYTFNTSQNTGWYKSSVNELSFTVNSAQAFKFNSSGLTMVSPFNLVDNQGNAAYAMPVGAIFAYGGTTAPPLWLFCFGQAVSATMYATLSTTLGTTFGTSVGNVVLPDLRGRLPFGKDDMGGIAANSITNAGSGITGTTLGASGGTQNITILQANLPNVASFTVTDPKHKHNPTFNSLAAGSQVQTGGSGTENTAAISIAAASTGVTVQAGAGVAQQTMNPALMINYIMYAGV